MPSVLICMKEMKENRDSMHMQTQIVDDYAKVELENDGLEY